MRSTHKIGGALAVSAAFALQACGGTASTSATTGSSAAPSNTPAKPTGATIGATFTLSDTEQGASASYETRLAVTLTQVEDPTPNAPPAPDPGYHRVCAMFTLKNVGSTPISSEIPSANTTLWASDGTTASSDPVDSVTQCSAAFSGDLKPGVSLTATAPFVIPDGATVSKIQYTRAGGDTGSWTVTNAR